MLKNAIHECNVFGPAQREALWREFTHHGWNVTVTAKANTQPPGPPWEEVKGEWVCRAWHPGWPTKEKLETKGKSMWDCLSKMASEITNAYQEG